MSSSLLAIVEYRVITLYRRGRLRAIFMSCVEILSHFWFFEMTQKTGGDVSSRHLADGRVRRVVIVRLVPRILAKLQAIECYYRVVKKLRLPSCEYA